MGKGKKEDWRKWEEGRRKEMSRVGLDGGVARRLVGSSDRPVRDVAQEWLNS